MRMPSTPALWPARRVHSPTGRRSCPSTPSRWDEKAGLLRDALSSRINHALNGAIERRPAMKKNGIRIRNGKGDWEGNKLTIGMDLGDRTSRYCVLGEEGEVLMEASVATTQKGLSEAFG